MKRQLVIEVICFLFIFLFVYAALMKWSDVEKFRVQLGQSPLLIAFADYLVWIVPAIELIISAMLIFRATRLIGLYASFTLMVMFTFYITIILTYADHVPCSCSGLIEKMQWREHLIFNIAFVLLAVGGTVLITAPVRIESNETTTETRYAS